jgi:hypothetical protein
MKKIILFLFASIVLFAANAQTQRKKEKIATDSTLTTTPAKTRGQKKEMMKELNLSKEQKIKLRNLKRDNKTKMDAINNDAALTETDKKAKLKELKKQQLAATMSVLNEEQKAKLKQLRKEKKGDEGEMMDEN